MPDKRLYALTLPAGTFTRAGSTARQQQALQALLGSDVGSVENIATEPGEQTITVEYPDQYAQVRAQELRELASGFTQPLPYYTIGNSGPDDRYVTVSRAEPGPIDPRATEFQSATITISDAGTPATHYRAVSADPAQADNPFGNVTSAFLGVPGLADKVRWFNPETGARTQVTVQEVRQGENADVDILDATEAPYDAPELLYTLDLEREGWADPRVYDTRGFADRLDGNGALQHAKVLSPSHRFEGDIVLDNDLLRVFIDEPADPGISAERYTSGSWSSVSLGASDWQVFDWDIRSVGTARVGGVAEFQDTTQSPTVYHTLRWRIDRGAEDVLWSSDSEVPSGLQTLLDPIAASHTLDAFGSIGATPTGLRSREEVV
jgi:hypothetical protein